MESVSLENLPLYVLRLLRAVREHPDVTQTSEFAIAIDLYAQITHFLCEPIPIHPGMRRLASFELQVVAVENLVKAN